MSWQTDQNQIYIEYSRYCMRKVATKLPQDAALMCSFILFLGKELKSLNPNLKPAVDKLGYVCSV
jgi:hypothetical protein